MTFIACSFCCFILSRRFSHLALMHCFVSIVDIHSLIHSAIHAIVRADTQPNVEVSLWLTPKYWAVSVAATNYKNSFFCCGMPQIAQLFLTINQAAKCCFWTFSQSDKTKHDLSVFCPLWQQMLYCFCFLFDYPTPTQQCCENFEFVWPEIIKVSTQKKKGRALAPFN